MARSLSCVFLAFALTGCVKDRDLHLGAGVGNGGEVTIAPGVLKVNEFVAAGSQNANEFGSNEDWFEIYNPNNSPLILEDGRWYVSDAGPSTPEKYLLPGLTIPAHGFVVIWCDSQNMIGTQIHTNFNLSSAGEHIVLYYNDGTQAFVVDDYQYGAQSGSGESWGRAPDGADNWIEFANPTPGGPNQ